jgi:hypothetical protein
MKSLKNIPQDKSGARTAQGFSRLQSWDARAATSSYDQTEKEKQETRYFLISKLFFIMSN